MTPRRILMTTDAVGGVWNYSLHLAKALAGYGVRFDLATMGPLPSESQKQEAAALANVALYESTYQLEWTQDPWDDIARAGEWLLELEQRLRPDIVHLNGYSHAALPWTAPACVVAHSCVLSWWEAVHGETAPDSWARYGAAVAEGIRKADHVIAPTAAMLKALRKNYGALPRSSVIHHGISMKTVSLGQRQPIVFAAGRMWDAAKNVDMIVRSAAELPWQFVIAGDGKCESTTTKNVSLLGRVSSKKIAQCMRTASIYCLPARYEPFGLSVLEAALSGCALVLGEIPSLCELWSDAAIFVHPDDQSGLTRILRQLADDERRRKQLAQLAAQRARRFTAERMAVAYLDMYEQLLESKGAFVTPDKTRP